LSTIYQLRHDRQFTAADSLDNRDNHKPTVYPVERYMRR